MKPPSKRFLVLSLVVLLGAYAGFVGFVWWSMHQPPETFARVMSKMPAPVVFVLAPFETIWTHARAGTLRPGELAPDFKLTKLDKAGQIQLSSLTAMRPVVLVFGSFT